MINDYQFHFKAIINLGIALTLIALTVGVSTAAVKLLIKKQSVWLRPIYFKSHELVSTAMLVSVLSNIVTAIKWILVLSILYLMIPFVLQELPVTHDYAVELMASVKSHLITIGDGLLNFIPNLFFIAFVIFLTRSLLRFAKFIFLKIEKEYIVIDGFYAEWAGTTFQLLRFFICMFALVIIYPYLPGSGTKALEGVSVFVGLMISLGSSSAIANIIAGVMISYMRAFKKGDYVKIGESMGKVTEKGLIVTKMITYKNEEITIPNTQVLSSQVTNYSTKAQSRDLILYTTITIGYDTPWTLVHKMMIEAAERSPLISQDKKPFVLQTALNDYHISYQLNAFTENEDKIPGAYSELHQNIQEVFAENQVEIMSPGFTVLRNTPKNTTPVLSK
ncbi:mechanosensitive ion channel domain-containing protein [Bacteriovorax sp. PP10]|uniref:Mechanosensitive ion channel domain-containing protein n=1 Tax=Bacteriovorax antarcticus TaxID=3088717 RepID=A0ABU5VX49_9BACT|nr:mechanosensitive ion channel domain-containing protein [Bacteriovorax sp. PP10]MEA9357634.1 mechanosensitive ion channel domain-containing protein [Bacteriovorax sp. PP10]